MYESVTGLHTVYSRLRGALRSGHPAARWGIARKALRPVGLGVERLLAPFLKTPDLTAIAPCVLIVSPPRSGSTVTYQVLTRAIPCVYPTNLHEVLPKLATAILRRRGGFGTGLTGFDNYYGYTAPLNDVNEANGWLTWILRAKDDADLRERFSNFAATLRAGSSEPIIMKNAAAYGEIARLHRAVPELLFLRVTRSLEQVVQSELRAHYELGSFNPLPSRLRELKTDDAVEFCVHQILEIEKTITAGLKHVAPDRQLTWDYETFCAETPQLIAGLAERLGVNGDQVRRAVLAEPLKASYRRKVSEADELRIRQLIKALNAGASVT